MIRHLLMNFVPPQMQKRNGFRYLYTFALVADATLEAGLQAMAARFPGFGTDTALSRSARDRGIRQGFAEPDADFALRLRTWLTDHKAQGSAFALMRQVQGYCHPKRPRIQHVINKPTLGITIWRTLDSDGTQTQEIKTSNFNWDNRDGDNTTPGLFSSRAWLIIYSTTPENPWDEDETWDDTATRTWDEDEALVNTWGSTALFEHIQGVRDIVREWKGAWSLYPEILVCFDDSLFDPADANPPNPDGNWRYYSKNVGGVQVLARAENTVFWIGTA